MWWQMKYTKLKEDWTMILELLQQYRERSAAMLVAKKASKTLLRPVCVSVYMLSLSCGNL